MRLDEVLRIPALRHARPRVVAGRDQLDRSVRWVHTTELADIGSLLRGGDLVLTTGIALPGSGEALRSFARGLAESEAAGLCLELGRRWDAVPPALLEECEQLGLPLIALHREVRFAAITQAVGERLVDAQLAELRETQRVHETFTELGLAEAGPREVLDAVGRLAGTAVAIETEQHQLLDVRPGPRTTAAFFDDWDVRSRQVAQDERTVWDESLGWLVTRVGRAERGWGRLVIECPEPPSPRDVAVAERGAAALALHRLHDRTRDHQVRRLHQELLLGLRTPDPAPELLRRVELAGIPASGCAYVGLALRPTALRAGQLDEVVTACLRAAELVRRPVLTAAFESGVRLLLPVPSRQDPERLVDRWAGHVAERVQALVAQGSPVTHLEAAHRTLREADQVLASSTGRTPGGVLRLHDLHVRGLLALTADDDRVRTFAERQLAPLDGSPDLLAAVRVLVERWDNKSAAASALHLSRAALYARIDQLERVLGVRLGDPEIRTSLHVALLVRDVTASTR